jgi:hypothetical protein
MFGYRTIAKHHQQTANWDNHLIKFNHLLSNLVQFVSSCLIAAIQFEPKQPSTLPVHFPFPIHRTTPFTVSWEPKYGLRWRSVQTTLMVGDYSNDYIKHGDSNSKKRWCKLRIMVESWAAVTLIWVKTYYYHILGNKHPLTNYFRVLKVPRFWPITI